MAHVLLTGISGMLGQRLALRLAEAGNRVLGLDLAPSRLDHPNIGTVTADVRDVHRLYRIFAEHRVDAIVHGGGVSGSMVMRDNPAEVAGINICGTVNLLEAARLHGVSRFVQCSTIMVYGPSAEAHVHEDRPLAPTNVYGASKAACEALVHSYCAEFGLSAALLRIAHAYGPTRRTYCPVRAMVAGALSGETVVLTDFPDTPRQLVHAEDVVDALACALVDRSPGTQVANIGPGAAWTVTDLAELIGELVAPVSIECRGSVATADYATGVLSVERAAEFWGWKPKIGLPEGIASLVRSIECAEAA